MRKEKSGENGSDSDPEPRASTAPMLQAESRPAASRLQAFTSGLVTAMRTLTIVPVPGSDAREFASALPWFPLVGLGLGSLLFGTAQALHLLTGSSWPQGEAALLVAAGALLTRGLHLDGLADWADGFFGGGQNREKVLAIMKDPRTGAFGAIALVTVLLCKWAAFSRLVDLGHAQWIIAALVISRAAQVELAATLPYARATGTAAPFINGARQRHRLLSGAAAVAIMAALFGVVNGLAAIAGAWLLSILFGRWCRARVGGVTGDLLGACSELIETAVAFGAALFIR